MQCKAHQVSYQSTAWFFVPLSALPFSVIWLLVPSSDTHTHAAQHDMRCLQVVEPQAHTVVGCDSLPDRDL
jgi:hypothetical protein